MIYVTKCSKQKNLRDRNLLQHKYKGGSLFWKGINIVKYKINWGITFRLGNGKTSYFGWMFRQEISMLA